jgi:chromosomal replication initiation ATPase DnaA
MSRVFAYRATAAGIQRLAQQRGQPIAAIEAVEAERAPVVVPVAHNVVRLVIPRTEAQQIIHDVAASHGLTAADILGKSRRRKVIEARFDAVAAVKTARPMMTLNQLGRLFKRDHTSAHAALRKRGMA